jgi:hypothetical protein
MFRERMMTKTKSEAAIKQLAMRVRSGDASATGGVLVEVVGDGNVPEKSA